MAGRTPLYPLRFREILRDYRFGDRWIARHFRKSDLPEDHRLAETWEVCDRPGESSEVINGPMAGRSLHELIEQYGADLLGGEIVERFGARFPLLIKFLDASHVLGEQVHHDDRLARRRGIPDSGKTEAWYILETRPGARMACGNRPGVDRAAVERAVLNGDAVACMRPYHPRPGDAFLLYAGLMHYAAGGMLFYEIMQNSDVWIGLGRPPDALSPEQRRRAAADAVEAVHLEDDIDCRTRPVTVRLGRSHRMWVLACEHFALERLDLAEPCEIRRDGRRFRVLSQIAGNARVRSEGFTASLAPGVSLLLPACLGRVQIEPEGPASLLLAYVPDLLRDVIEPLRAGGFDDASILALGGRTRLNPLRNLL